METDVAQPAVGAACVAMLGLLRNLGCEPDMFGGHSYGELVALHAAGAMSAAGVGRALASTRPIHAGSGPGAAGSMAAILAAPADVERLIHDVPGVQVANWNGPRQTVIAGPTAAVKQALELAAARGSRAGSFRSRRHFTRRWSLLLVSRWRPWQASCSSVPLPGRSIPTSMRPLIPPSPARSPRRLGDHLAGPVRFAEMIEAMHRDGARVFVEVGPGSILTPLIGADLERPASSGRCVRCTGIVGLIRLASHHWPAGRGRAAAGARVSDPWTGAPPARSGTSAARRIRGAAVPFNLAGQRQPGTPTRRARAYPIGTGTPGPRRARRNRECLLHPMAPRQPRPSRMVPRPARRPPQGSPPRAR